MIILFQHQLKVIRSQQYGFKNVCKHFFNIFVKIKALKLD